MRLISKVSFSLLIIFLGVSFWLVNSSHHAYADRPSTLKEVYKNDFLMGVALGSRDIFHYYKYPMRKDKKELSIVNREFNCITAENLMKPMYINPHPDQYYFDAVDEMMRFAEKNNHEVVGHVLVWHAMTAPSFFENDKGDLLSREAMIERMRDYIYTVVGRYKGRIKYWDVVNEAVDLKTVKDENGRSVQKAVIRESKWSKIIGDDFIDLAFQFAHEADPDAELIYNDFTMNNAIKAQFVADMCSRMRSKGIRVDGVGMQAHWHLNYPSAKELKVALDIFRKANLKVHLTELDIGVLERPDTQQDADISRNIELQAKLNPYTNDIPDHVLLSHAKKYEQIFEILLQNRDLVDRVTFWGVSDSYSWLNDWPIEGRTSHPLLFDRKNKSKPAYEALIELGNSFLR